MISVGIDISKDKSFVCIMKPFGEVICKPFECNHTESDLYSLSEKILSFDEEVRVVMEATGIYHYPVLMYLKSRGIFVSVQNPLVIKKYSNTYLRKGKTDKKDAAKLANYGIEKWIYLVDYEPFEETYDELRYLSRQYIYYQNLRVTAKINLSNILERTMPRIKSLLRSNSSNFRKDKLTAFAMKYWHYDNITSKSEKQFVDNYNKWVKKEGFRQSAAKAKEIYGVAQDSIPTLSSKRESTKMLVQNACRTLLEIDKVISNILSQMQAIAKDLKEYDVVRIMPGVGDVLAVRIIAEIGDVRKFKSAKSLTAYAGLDAPPFQSGGFESQNRKISKRGSSQLRKTGYEIITCLKSIKPVGDPVYDFLDKKIKEGKAIKVDKIAALNKFLRIYYARVKEVYSEN